LANRYNSGDRVDIATPVKPSWCFEEDGSGEEDEQADTTTTGFRKRKKRRREIIKKDAKFVFDTPLVTVAHSPIREEVQEACQIICGWERYLVYKYNNGKTLWIRTILPVKKKTFQSQQDYIS